MKHNDFYSLNVALAYGILNIDFIELLVRSILNACADYLQEIKGGI